MVSVFILVKGFGSSTYAALGVYMSSVPEP